MHARPKGGRSISEAVVSKNSFHLRELSVAAWTEMFRIDPFRFSLPCSQGGRTNDGKMLSSALGKRTLQASGFSAYFSSSS